MKGLVTNIALVRFLSGMCQSEENKYKVKGTVSVISSDSPCKEDNAWFTMVPVKALFNQIWIR